MLAIAKSEKPLPRAVSSRPEGAIQGSVLDGFGDVFWLQATDAFEVGDGASYLQNAVVSACGQALLRHRPFEQAFAIRGELAEGADVARAHLGVAEKFVARRAGEAF